jgi:hypothetical protein
MVVLSARHDGIQFLRPGFLHNITNSLIKLAGSKNECMPVLGQSLLKGMKTMV